MARTKASQMEPFQSSVVALTAFAEAPRDRQETPKQREARELREAISKKLNEAAALPASEGVVLELPEGANIQNYRNAFKKIWEGEPRALNVYARSGRIIVTKGTLPGGKGPWTLGPSDSVEVAEAS